MKNDFCGWCCLLTTIKCNYQKFAREHLKKYQHKKDIYACVDYTICVNTFQFPKPQERQKYWYGT